MASQIAHVVYGEKARRRFLGTRQIDSRAYFIGNLFPDIRYLKVISREETHSQNPVVSNLPSFNNSFDLGVYVHSLVDWEREKTLTKLGMYGIVEKDLATSTALKLLEDEITYPLYQDWETIINDLDTILKEEISLVSKEAVIKWHHLLKLYFSQKKDARDLLRSLDYDEKLVSAVYDRTQELKREKRVISIIERVFEKIFE